MRVRGLIGFQILRCDLMCISKTGRRIRCRSRLNDDNSLITASSTNEDAGTYRQWPCRDCTFDWLNPSNQCYAWLVLHISDSLYRSP